MNRVRRLSPGHWLGLAFLLMQLVSIGYARFVPERFFCWAPYDAHSRYQVTIEVDGAQLSPDAIWDRYHYRANAWEPRSVYNLFSIIRQYESTYGKDENARVTVRYSINGHPERLWIWPE